MAYPWWHATRAELLNRLGRACAAYDQALLLGMNDPQAEHLRRRLTGTLPGSRSLGC